MDVITEKCCGIDVHQKQITLTTLIGRADQKPRKNSRRYGTTSPELRQCANWLLEKEVEVVLMESTGQYWRPVWQILEPYGFKMVLCNPRIIKNIPGKKTDQKDSEWIAELARLGLVAASFIPPRPIQELRESTRTRKSLTETATSIKNKIHNILQRSNIKLTTYVTDIFGSSGQKLLVLLIQGKPINLQTVSKCMHAKLKAKPEMIVAALDGSLSPSDRQILKIELALLADVQQAIHALELLIEEQLQPLEELYLRLQTIPGISKHIAQIVIAEVGTDVSPFPTAHHLASWAGLCPGNYESAGQSKSSHILHGNVYLKTALVTAALGAKRQTCSGLKDFFYRLKGHMSAQKAVVALAHKLLRITYAMIETGSSYQEYRKDQRAKALVGQ
ncbi:IS110 family transposase [Lentilactobacillus hilgardii]|jgi:transposase|uniref:IS110 family transposase n=1 Tax=Lentilactobacillus hilgardii TaxID=1588 RepID=A0A6P1EB18_LENHI|nr:IS110 family transposase [Lentilactobacillus hilgardii]EEI70559.1 transposase, IS116/IS110/IS902 family [Lentilactobacillus hilgardii ATCC 27305]MCT3393241.1 IS110 family transposase [Lentilactobacillus hilgardii]QHB51434.1 IS110 family transposase [Lentilactobacillus hilgardii]QHB51943.1 IS110 family transposase [Lentilactobacillus hilgardii]QHB52365.1 IS110 family transposase [Lentilactobacillus hilgardii]